MNANDYYRRAAIICHTSVSESFGLVLAEGMSYGAVPIAFDCYPACKDLIPNNCGFRIPNVSRKDYVDKLVYLMDNPSVRQQYSDNAQSYVLKFNIDNIRTDWARLIEQVSNKS